MITVRVNPVAILWNLFGSAAMAVRFAFRLTWRTVGLVTSCSPTGRNSELGFRVVISVISVYYICLFALLGLFLFFAGSLVFSI
jgi:hypothetical protein